MKLIYLSVLFTICLILSACGGAKPKVQEVPQTEPWTSMKLPCQTVVVSNSHRFNCAYGETRTRENEIKAITPYIELLKQNGWKVTQDLSESIGVQSNLSKDDKELIIFSTSSSIQTEDGAREWQGFGIQAEILTKK
ncbi:MAG: hypothetical protein ABJA66_06750 [Actinomycetota bacterium]